MKTIVICALALIALANGQIDRDGEIDANPFTHQLRIRSTGESQVCEPGSTKMIECNHCFCRENGSGWGCTRKGCFVYPNIFANPDGTNTQSHEANPPQGLGVDGH